MNAIDTNIWIYSHDRRDAAKQQKALNVITSARPLALVWQVGCEFIAASRKLQPFGFTTQQAWDALTDMMVIANMVLFPIPELWPETRNLQQHHGFSFWDALLVAACIRGGVDTLYSEDLGGNPPIGGLSFVNPFATP